MNVGGFKTREEDIPHPESKEEKTTRLHAELVTTEEIQAPRYDRVGVHGGFVNSSCKPYSVVKTLILALSAKSQTVYDFFSGGQVLKALLLLHRECIAFASSAKEHLFLITYPVYLRQHPYIDRF